MGPRSERVEPFFSCQMLELSVRLESIVQDKAQLSVDLKSAQQDKAQLSADYTASEATLADRVRTSCPFAIVTIFLEK